MTPLPPSLRVTLGVPNVCLVGKTRRAPSRHCRDPRVYGHTTTAMHDMSTLSPPHPIALQVRGMLSLAETLPGTKIRIFSGLETGGVKRALLLAAAARENGGNGRGSEGSGGGRDRGGGGGGGGDSNGGGNCFGTVISAAATPSNSSSSAGTAPGCSPSS